MVRALAEYRLGMADSITGVRRIDDHMLEVSLIAPAQYSFHTVGESQRRAGDHPLGV